MAPQITQTRLPHGYTLEPTPHCQPRAADERPLLRDRDGHVLAVVERLPDIAIDDVN